MHSSLRTRMTATRSLSQLWTIFFTVVTAHLCAVSANCPWKEEGLLLWSDPDTWDDGTVPQLLDEVNVTKRVLLDVQPPSLATITVLPGAALVWDHVDGIVLNVSYILVHGEFHIGSQKCRFQKTATINLYGRLDSPYEVPRIGRKFVAVTEGGQLELHGRKKTSWTKVAHTIPPASEVFCGMPYDHKTSEMRFYKEPTNGLHVIIWNKDGFVRDFGIFRTATYHELPMFLKDLPPGCIVAAAVQKNLGGTTQPLFKALEALGAKLIRKVSKGQRYAFLARTGYPESTQETLEVNKYLVSWDPPRDLVFLARSTKDVPDFKVQDGEVANPLITVVHDVSSWKIGDEVLVTSTDFDWRQTEVKRIVRCDECNKNQIKLDSAFEYMHYGEITHRVDERAEVALLSRNIKIQGQLEDECYVIDDDHKWLCKAYKHDLFGGQTKAVFGSTVHIEGVELFQMGQQQVLASYPLHFHMMVDGTGMWFKNNSIHHSNSRCVTVHGTHNTEVSDNVCYVHLGHGFFLEDSVEQNTTMDRNLGVGTLHGGLLMSDRKKEWCKPKLRPYCDSLATFWLTHPNNIVTRNVAAGSDFNGFHYTFAYAPLGLSKYVKPITDVVADESLRHYPIKAFRDNTAHSNADSGLFFDSTMSNGEYVGKLYLPEGAILLHELSYQPRDPPNANGTIVWTSMERYTGYKNIIQNAWVRGGNIRLVNSSLADSPMGFAGGTIPRPPSGAEVKDSVFVGETDNKGQPITYIERDIEADRYPVKHFDRSIAKNPYESLTGVGFYKGPMFVDNCHFSNYRTWWWADHWQADYGIRPVRPSGALSFRRINIYPTRPWSYVNNLKFDSCDDVGDNNHVFNGNISTHGWTDKDGNKAATFMDLDGSVTGHPRTQVVINRPFYTGPECVYHNNWQMMACPYKYIEMLVTGTDGVLKMNKRSKSPIIMRRDDEPKDLFFMEGEVNNRFLLRAHRSYTIFFNKELDDNPTYVELMGTGMDKGDVVRMAVCFPSSTKNILVYSAFPVEYKLLPMIMATSLRALDNDLTGRLFYWDRSVGMLYVKFMTNNTRQDRVDDCPFDHCPKFKIFRLDGDSKPTDCNFYKNPVYKDKTMKLEKPLPKVCKGPDSAEGLGAPPSEPVLKSDPFSIICPTIKLETVRLTPEYRGCYRDKPQSPDVPYFSVELINSMTHSFCQFRCFYRKFAYAALTVGRRCWCGDQFGLHGGLADEECDKPCSGNTSTLCGGASKIGVFTSGLVPKMSPDRCGPNNVGEVVEGSCLYVQHQLLSVAQAQRRCARLGGYLVTIHTAEKQAAVEAYLRDKVQRTNVWSGLNQARKASKWEHRDGTLLGKTYSKWKGTHGADRTRNFVFLSPPDMYEWVQTKEFTMAAPLCDLPLSPPALEPCGYNGQGRRLGPDGTCYLVLHDLHTKQPADYACRANQGRLASFTTLEEEIELAHILYILGVDQDYFVANDKIVMKWTDQSVYISSKSSPKDVAGALCVLSILDETNRCPPDWILNKDSCYLYQGDMVDSYGAAAALCEWENSTSHLPYVESQEEASFLSFLFPFSYAHSMLMGLRYSPRDDRFQWGDGRTLAFTAWQEGQGMDNLGPGWCALLDPVAFGKWKNQDCNVMEAALVCEMPAYAAAAASAAGGQD